LDEVFQGFEGFWLGLGNWITFFSQAITYMPLKQVIGMMLSRQTGVRVLLKIKYIAFDFIT
jgi:hypothetical protein